MLEVVNAKPQPVAWLLWGDFAIEMADKVPVDNSSHERFENAHPSAGRASRALLNADPPFAKASKFLGTDPHSDWTV